MQELILQVASESVRAMFKACSIQAPSYSGMHPFIAAATSVPTDLLPTPIREEPDAVAGTSLSAQATVQPDNNEVASAVEDEAELEGQEYGHDEEDTIQDLLDYGDGEELLDYGEPGGSEVEEEDEQPVTQESREETGLQKGSPEEQQVCSLDWVIIS